MRLNDDGKTVAAMDVLVPKVGELVGGSQREDRCGCSLKLAPCLLARVCCRVQGKALLYCHRCRACMDACCVLCREDVLQQRVQELGINIDEAYLDLRRYGSVPHSGFGLGFERLIMFATGLENIRDVIPFPRWPGNVSF
jgi:asparaginyl-tRNA synthetase